MYSETKQIIHKKNKRGLALTQIGMIGDIDDYRFGLRKGCL